eukprot:2213947-Rhodomonas_salina.1
MSAWGEDAKGFEKSRERIVEVAQQIRTMHYDNYRNVVSPSIADMYNHPVFATFLPVGGVWKAERYAAPCGAVCVCARCLSSSSDGHCVPRRRTKVTMPARCYAFKIVGWLSWGCSRCQADAVGHGQRRCAAVRAGSVEHDGRPPRQQLHARLRLRGKTQRPIRVRPPTQLDSDVVVVD